MQESRQNTKIHDMLFRRLSYQGLTGVEISRLIKDVCNIMRDHHDSTIASVMENLEQVGWQEEIIDSFGFASTIVLIQNECHYESNSLS
jgi:hypothetical protein